MMAIKYLTFIFVVFANTTAFGVDTPLDEIPINSDGTPVTTVQEIDRYKDPQETAREKEIKDLKCTICQTRCNLVYQAGTGNCQTNNGRVVAGCQEKGDDFVNQCLKQCSEC